MLVVAVMVVEVEESWQPPAAKVASVGVGSTSVNRMFPWWHGDAWRGIEWRGAAQHTTAGAATVSSQHRLPLTWMMPGLIMFRIASMPPAYCLICMLIRTVSIG